MEARIGPNAVLQHLPVLDAEIGVQRRTALFARAGVAVPPPGAGLLPEDEVARRHRAVRRHMPGAAARIGRAAGLATGDYILAHRIPTPARRLIRLMPAPLGARLLAGAIARHAWTFAGSGRFAIAAHRPLVFTIADNPLCGGADAPGPVCDWHAAVFERLFARLVWPGVTVCETACCGAGAPVCSFELRARESCLAQDVTVMFN